MKRALLLLATIATVGCDRGKVQSAAPKAPPSPPPPPVTPVLRKVPVGKVIDGVIIEKIHFDDSEMSVAIDLARSHIDTYCKDQGILEISVASATSRHKMSFGSSAMTARMLLKMIASEGSMDLEIDEEQRVVRFNKRSGSKPNPPNKLPR